MTSQECDYDVCLSFAGEERDYVEEVASELKRNGIKVFYDVYEAATLWGKDLYQHLDEVYRQSATYCVVFISKNYAMKLWPKHEIKSAQARAFKENIEYILPVKFDDTEIPGLPETIGYLNGQSLTPINIAKHIIEKISRNSSPNKYNAELNVSIRAKVDVDFCLNNKKNVTKIIKGLKSHTWPEQNKAINKINETTFDTAENDDLFILGRNILQAAEGNANEAIRYLNNLRSNLSACDDEKANYVAAGTLFEIYFNNKGEFRYNMLKKTNVDLASEFDESDRFSPALNFLNSHLSKFSDMLPYIPGGKKEAVTIEIRFDSNIKADAGNNESANYLNGVKINGKELMCKDGEFDDDEYNWIKMSPKRSYCIEEIINKICNEFMIPEKFVKTKLVNYDENLGLCKIAAGHIVLGMKARGK